MSRVAARAAVMQMIFEKISGGHGGEETLRMVYDELREDGIPGVEKISENEPNPSDRAYINKVMQGVLDNLEIIDQKIENAAKGWTLERMSLVDLTIMRLAAWEILYEDDVPGNVAISEALGLTAYYSDPDDKSFINGILGTILRDHEAQQK